MAAHLDAVTGVVAPAPSSGAQTGSGRSESVRLAAVQRGIAAVQAAVEQIRESLSSSRRTLEFQADPVTELVIVTIRDAATGEAVRQIPGSALLSLADLLAARSDAPRALVDLTA